MAWMWTNGRLATVAKRRRRLGKEALEVGRSNEKQNKKETKGFGKPSARWRRVGLPSLSIIFFHEATDLAGLGCMWGSR